MADATRLATMNKQIDEQRTATEALTTQIEKLMQSQTQIDKLLQSQQKLEAMVTAIVSHNGGQAPGSNLAVSGDLTSS